MTYLTPKDLRRQLVKSIKEKAGVNALKDARAYMGLYNPGVSLVVSDASLADVHKVIAETIEGTLYYVSSTSPHVLEGQTMINIFQRKERR